MAKYDASYNKILNIESQAIHSLIQDLDKEIMDKIVDLLCTIKSNRNRVITAGCGTSGVAAQKIAHILNVVEIPAFYCSPSNSIHGGMGSIQKDDVVILITKGGDTQEILNYIPVCKSKGAIIIGVTENENSTLGKNCDILLKIKVEKEACPWNFIASSSTLAVISAWDAITLTAMQHNGFTKEQFYLIHPGGSAGEKFKKYLNKETEETLK